MLPGRSPRGLFFFYKYATGSVFILYYTLPVVIITIYILLLMRLY